jgi:hypothetical protein
MFLACGECNSLNVLLQLWYCLLAQEVSQLVIEDPSMCAGGGRGGRGVRRGRATEVGCTSCSLLFYCYGAENIGINRFLLDSWSQTEEQDTHPCMFTPGMGTA